MRTIAAGDQTAHHGPQGGPSGRTAWRPPALEILRVPRALSWRRKASDKAQQDGGWAGGRWWRGSPSAAPGLQPFLRAAQGPGEMSGRPPRGAEEAGPGRHGPQAPGRLLGAGAE